MKNDLSKRINKRIKDQATELKQSVYDTLLSNIIFLRDHHLSAANILYYKLESYKNNGHYVYEIIEYDETHTDYETVKLTVEDLKEAIELYGSML